MCLHRSKQECSKLKDDEPLDLSMHHCRKSVNQIINGASGSLDKSFIQPTESADKSNDKNPVTYHAAPTSFAWYVFYLQIGLYSNLFGEGKSDIVSEKPKNQQAPNVSAVVDCASVTGNQIGDSNKRSSPSEVSENSAKRQRRVRDPVQVPDPVISYPAPKGTEHPYNGILYQVPQTKGQGSRWLINWTAPNWTQGPTVVGRSSLNHDICFKKHNALRRDYMQWLKTYRDPMKCALEIEFIMNMAVRVGVNADPNASLLYRLFKARFLVGGDQAVVKQLSDFRLWHLYCYKRYLMERANRLNRPNGDCKKYGHQALFAICSIVGSKDNVRQFARHFNEIL